VEHSSVRSSFQPEHSSVSSIRISMSQNMMSF
jgi:hypothetical protein